MAEDVKMTGRGWAEEITKLKPRILQRLEETRGKEEASEFWAASGQLETIAAGELAATETYLRPIAAKARSSGFTNTAALDKAVLLILEEI